MNIVVNAQFLQENNLEGLGWFSFETLKRMTKNHPEHRFYFIFSSKNYQQFLFAENIIPCIVGPKFNHPLIWLYKFEFVIPRLLKKYKADLFLSPTGISSLRTFVPTLTVIHDLNFEHYPQNLSFSYRLYYKYFFPRWAKKAVRLATVSEFSKQDISKRYDIDSDKIDVVYNGANDSLHPISELEKTSVKIQYTNDSPYFVFVGATPPRKNISNLFRAFDLYKSTTKNPHKLVLVGAKKWWSRAIKQSYDAMEFKDDVVFTGRVNTEMLNKFISSSEALTYVSLFEGFGIPLIEAMHCETAIITSNCTSMPEIAGDAAFFVDPLSPQSICEAMIAITNDNSLRQSIIEKGNLRKKAFSWDSTASKMWNCIEKVILEINV